MQKQLKFIKEEDEKSYNDEGSLQASLAKQYFNYVCHDADAQCQISPVVCRTVDLLNPENEPHWQSNAPECERCFGVNDRALEELYSRSYN